MSRLISSLACCLPLVLACASSPTAPDVRGEWGGTEASLVLSATGGTVSYPCGAGTIDSGWTLGADSRFLASGQHYFGGGPMPPEGHPGHPARYQGHLMGATLEFSVIVTDLGDTLGPFHLVRGGPAVPMICD